MHHNKCTPDRLCQLGKEHRHTIITAQNDTQQFVVKTQHNPLGHFNEQRDKPHLRRTNVNWVNRPFATMFRLVRGSWLATTSCGGVFGRRPMAVVLPAMVDEALFHVTSIGFITNAHSAQILGLAFKIIFKRKF